MHFVWSGSKQIIEPGAGHARMPMTSRHSPGPVHTTVGVVVSHVRLRAHSGATVSTCDVWPSGITAQCSGGVLDAGEHAAQTRMVNEKRRNDETLHHDQ